MPPDVPVKSLFASWLNKIVHGFDWWPSSLILGFVLDRFHRVILF